LLGEAPHEHVMVCSSSYSVVGVSA
jgi:hypothetical protein